MTLSFIPYNQLVKDTLEWCETNANRETVVDSWRFLLGVVGVPKSGMVPAQIIASRFNCPLADVEYFLTTGGRFYPGKGSRSNQFWDKPERFYSRGSLLVVDDSVHEGSTLRSVREDVLRHAGISTGNIEFAAVYGSGYCKDFSYFKEVPLPRIFEWNWTKHPALEWAMLDMDGVICENWTGPRDGEPQTVKQYEEWLEWVNPLYLPTRKVAAVVSARIEKYRHQTRVWLDKWGVRYENLYLCQSTWEELRANNSHWVHKAEIYRLSQSNLFVESDHDQAEKIAKESGKPVFVPPKTTHNIYTPGEVYG